MEDQSGNGGMLKKSASNRWEEKAASGATSLKTSFTRVVRMRESAIILVIALAFISLSLASPFFLTSMNLRALFVGISLDAIIVVGVTMGLILGGLDISVGSVLGLGAAVVGTLIRAGMNPFLAALLTIGSGGVVGCVNGFFVTKLGIKAIIVTLGMFNVARGLAFVITRGVPVTGFPKVFSVLGRGTLGPVPVPIVIMLVILVVFSFLMKKVRFFHQLYFVGSNENAARFSGIAVNRARFVSMVISGSLAALAGVLMASRLSSVQPNYGIGTEFRVIAGALIGGVSLDGGRGTIIGASLGVLFMGLVNNALILLGVSVVWQKVVLGSFLLLAVVVDTILSKRREAMAR